MEPAGRTTERPVRKPRSEKNCQERAAKANPFKHPLYMKGKQFAVLKVTDRGERVVRGLSETGSSHDPVKYLRGMWRHYNSLLEGNPRGKKVAAGGNEMNEQREVKFTCDICGESCARFPVGGLLETVSMTIPIETCIHCGPIQWEVMQICRETTVGSHLN